MAPPMTRRVHEIYPSPAGGEVPYATPDGAVVHVPEDFAFADTVIATDEELPLSGHPLSQPPPSGPRSVRGGHHPELHDPWAGAMYETRAGMARHPRQTALTGPPPPPSYAPLPPNAGPVTVARSMFVRAKNEIDSSRHEMKELWSATYDDAEAARLANEEDPFVRLAGKLRRLRTMFSFFEWDRADLMRAAWIGLAVLVVVVAVGAFALHR